MGKIYNSPLLTSGLAVSAQEPIDDRLVVKFTTDLLLNDTWRLEENGTVYTYDGMCVSVVRDGSKNGIYMLPNRTKYDRQAWDTSANNYAADGWRRIDGSSTTANVNMDENQFNGDGTQQNPYVIAAIDGGDIANTSNQQNI